MLGVGSNYEHVVNHNSPFIPSKNEHFFHRLLTLLSFQTHLTFFSESRYEKRATLTISYIPQKTGSNSHFLDELFI